MPGDPWDKIPLFLLGKFHDGGTLFHHRPKFLQALIRLPCHGLVGKYDVAKQENSFLKLNPLDCYVTFAFGCDTYMPYFKFIPEIKFCIGLTDVLDRNRDLPDPLDIKYTNSIKKMVSSMIVLSFYFE